MENRFKAGDIARHFKRELLSEEELDLGTIETGFANYITSNGEFTIAFPPTDAQFFYLRVDNY